MIIFYQPQFRAFTQAGEPASGAKLYFYKYGTTTLQNTYQDADLTTPHTNPVVADSNGWFDPIFFGTSFDYKAVCTNSDGSETYFTVDDIPNAELDGEKIKDGTIPTSALADEAVTLAKMADLARGSIIVGSTSNRPTALALGDGEIPVGDGTDVTAGSVPLPKGYKYGFTLSLDTDTDHDIQVEAGVARDSTDTVNIVGSGMTKRIDASWAAGDDEGGMFTGSVANSTVYYFFAIVKDSDSSVDYGFDTSSTAANIPSGYTKYVLLDQLLTDSSGNLINSMNGKFVSEDQTITSAGQLVIPHGLGSDPGPQNVSVLLVNVTDENGYTTGDITKAADTAPDGGSGTSAKSVAIETDSSNITIRYASGTQVFNTINSSTGANAVITNANWKCRFIAKEDS